MPLRHERRAVKAGLHACRLAGAQPNRLPGLDLLRSIAILWVMLFHAFIVGGLAEPFETFSNYGWVGVDIFFVLSGFLIGSQLLRSLRQGEGIALGAFYARRAWRILPAFAVVLALYQCFPSLREAPGLQPWWQFATFTVNLLIDYRHNQAFSHAWSLCVEEHFYLVFPLLAWLLTRRPSAKKFLLLCGTVVVLGIALRAIIWLHLAGIDHSRGWFVEHLYYPTWTRLDGLLTGVMLAVLRIYRPEQWARLQARSTSVLLVAVAVLGLAFWLFSERTGLLANALGWPVLSFGFGLLVLAATDPNGWLGRRELPGVCWLATVSYSLYLSHKIAMHLVHEHIAPSMESQGWLLFAIYVAAILLCGAALHYLVERPGLRLRDRLAARSTPTQLMPRQPRSSAPRHCPPGP